MPPKHEERKQFRKERKQFRKEIERFVEGITGDDTIVIKNVDIYITYENEDGDIITIANNITEFEEGE